MRYGQAGGGVEAYFAGAVTNAKVPPKPVRTLPDERSGSWLFFVLGSVAALR